MNTYNRKADKGNRQRSRQSAISFVESLLKSILCIAIVISIALTLVAAIVKYRLFNTTATVNAVITPEYYSMVNEQVEQAVQDCCTRLDLDGDGVMAVIDSAQISSMTANYVTSLADRALKGGEFVPQQYPREQLRAALDRLFDESEAKNGQEPDDGMRDSCTQALGNAIDCSVQTLGSDIGEGLSDFYNSTHCIISTLNEFALFAIFSAVMLAVYFFSMKRSLLTKLYHITAAIWMGVSLVFIPAAMVYVCGVPDAISAHPSPLSQLTASLVKYFTDFAILITMTVWAIATVMLIVCIILLVRRPYKHIHRSRSRDSYDDTLEDDYATMEQLSRQYRAQARQVSSIEVEEFYNDGNL